MPTEKAAVAAVAVAGERKNKQGHPPNLNLSLQQLSWCNTEQALWASWHGESS